ncbi:ATP phosphoribosyltransferase regulatory subunit [Clostridium sp. SHJSY1]|uniref:ATP phosphoribosyltransferase regulatory subunit n=1 Tax=Clostridium sp. SHJSY1 TaxID=2942483 RepID=UPI002874FF0C|nr:ATP phosphoribosyltransferase regulatory subunit [Clostridium sp. SHJSY1]MDS0525066.1 ATP phosphoribosyltransferase regulatory subunit [Clostridium sp. SHJSY1]
MTKKYITPEGTRDLVLGECAIKKKLQMDIEEILDKWGYKEVVTPTIEFYETFNSGFQNLREEEVYKFFDNRGKILVLRPDMTIPIARVVATKFKDIPGPIRFRYSSNVYRVHESLGGKKNEYTDCGVELVGTEDKFSDLEILVTALDVLKVLQVSDYKLEVGNINFFNSAIKELNLGDEDRIKLAELIDRKSLKELDEYLDYLEVEDNYKEFFKKVPWLFGGKEVLEKGKKYCFNDEVKNSIEYLEKLSEVLYELGYGDMVTYDLGMVPRLDYYTGIIFRGYVEGVGVTVLSGGRYDNLISYFGEDRKAVGFSINLDSVMDIMKDKKIEQKQSYKLCYGKKFEIEAFKKAEELRKQGFVVNMICNPNENRINVQEGGNNR